MCSEKKSSPGEKICVTSQGESLDSIVDSRFGRCAYFIFYDTDTKSIETQANSNAQLQGGAGIQSAQLVASYGVKAVLTGNVGPNAYQTLSVAGIEIYTGISGSIKEAIEQYKAGKLKITQTPSVNSKFGMGK
ncbi:MAG: NifB/NifX family molybdenum-iron cluster-binding protein [Candidatus Omnitrophota bacterium]|nr:NifB/NifX family molybdenum-iron cluster-binding protein [Candidatus Omnitrophota bacterium]